MYMGNAVWLTDRCKHNVYQAFCCRCHYGDIARSVAQEGRVRDLTDDLRIGVGFKLIKGFNIINGRAHSL
jgi:hypothetical protein